MNEIEWVLKANGYKKITFRVLKTQHLLIKAKINGISGNFILDTGASTTCLANTSVDFFRLEAEYSSTKASGAGAMGMDTQITHHNILKLGHWKRTDFSIVVFDLSHVNEALQSFNVAPVHGIIGADVLLSGKAHIDYANHKLFLR